MVLWPLACFLLISEAKVFGISTAQSEIKLTGLELTPSEGTLVWISASWDLRVFSEALNSLGDLDQQFNQQVGGNIAVQSTVSNAEALAEASDLPSGTAAAKVQTPNDLPFSSFAMGSAEFQGEFMITGTAGPFVTLTIKASIEGSGSIDTGPSTATAPVSFALEVNGSPTLNYLNSVSGGPGSSSAFSFSEDLTGSILLPAGATFFIIATEETDPYVDPVPEGSPGISAIFGLGLLISLQHRLSQRRVK